jgi:hypothetical protein
MGNECKACRKRNPEEELILNAPIQKNSESETIDNSKSSQKYQTFKEIINSNPEHYKKLLKIKNALLTYQKRQIYKNMLKKLHENQKIFTYEEYIETISTKNFSFQEKNINNTYKYKSGASYTGQWLGGFRHGFGTMTWPDGIIYEGYWAFGLAEGLGKLTYPSGQYLKGNFKYNKLNGYGEVHNLENGYEYWGNWENDQQMGRGREEWTGGSSYEGNYEYGNKEGIGKYTWEDGTFYHGEWKNNKIHGLGFYKWADGRQYIGEWKNAKMNGFGISIWNHGQYIGNYRDDKRWGFGVYIDNNKNKYEGFWENGQHKSFGRYIKNDGSVKIGYSEGNKLSKIISNENEFLIRNDELNNLVEENNKKIIYIYQSIKKLLGQDYNNDDINNNEFSGDDIDK